MRLENTSVLADQSQEVSALMDTLLKTGRRLEELTGGQVDTIVDGDGRTLFLRGTQEQLSYSEKAKQAAILNALPSNIALLNPDGIIIAVNDAWRNYAAANAKPFSAGHAVGTNYIEICETASGEAAL